MSITVECQRCGKGYRVGDDKAGQKMKCKECDSIVPIPEADFLVDDEVEELDDVFLPQRTESRSRPARRSESEPKRTGFRSYKFQFIGATCVILAGAAAVGGILHIGGVFRGDGTAENESSDSKANRFANSGTEIAIEPATILVSETNPPEGLRAKLTVTKGNDELVASNGATFLWAPYYRTYGRLPDENDEYSLDPLYAPQPRSIGAAEFKLLLNVSDRLEQVAAAMREYHEKWRALPAPYQRGHGLSWRVQILPMLGEEELYKKFKLDEPWNSPHNKPLIAEMPDVFKTDRVKESGKTSMHVFVGEGTPFGAAPKKRGKYEYHIKYRIRRPPLDPNTKYRFSLKLIDDKNGSKTVFEETREIPGSELQGKTEYVWRFEREQKPVKWDPVQISDVDFDTFCAVVAGHETAMEWTKPGGLKIDSFTSTVYWGEIPQSGMPAVFFNGLFTMIPKDVDQKTIVLMAQHVDQTHFRPTYGANVVYRGKSAQYVRHEEKVKQSQSMRKRIIEALKTVQDPVSAKVAAAKISQIADELKQFSKIKLPPLSGVEQRIFTFQMKTKAMEFALEFTRDDVRALLRSGNEPELKAAFEKLKSVEDEIRNKKSKPLI